MNASALVITTMVVAGLAAAGFATVSYTAQPFSPYVDDKGNITLPKDFRSWSFLGTWGVAAEVPSPFRRTLDGHPNTAQGTLGVYAAIAYFMSGSPTSGSCGARTKP